jgi:hypothetical protein
MRPRNRSTPICLDLYACRFSETSFSGSISSIDLCTFHGSYPPTPYPVGRIVGISSTFANTTVRSPKPLTCSFCSPAKRNKSRAKLLLEHFQLRHSRRDYFRRQMSLGRPALHSYGPVLIEASDPRCYRIQDVVATWSRGMIRLVFFGARHQRRVARLLAQKINLFTIGWMVRLGLPGAARAFRICLLARISRRTMSLAT